jgi:parallel beta-helix repeat protein
MKNNIIVNCSDVGIYLNKAKNTKLLFNTLIATSGIDFRYPSSSGEAHGNVLSGSIRARDGASFTAGTNLTGVSTFDSWYVAPLLGDLTRKGDLAALLQKAAPRADLSDDYCARQRSDDRLDLGALEHTLGDCDTTRPPAAAPVGPDAGGGPEDAGARPDAATRPDAASASSRDAHAGADPDGGATQSSGDGADKAGGGGGCSLAYTGRAPWWAVVGLALVVARRRAARSRGAHQRRAPDSQPYT